MLKRSRDAIAGILFLFSEQFPIKAQLALKKGGCVLLELTMVAYWTQKINSNESGKQAIIIWNLVLRKPMYCCP
jgi:hypothetical protein